MRFFNKQTKYDLIFYIIFIILYAYPGWFNLYSKTVSHSSFYMLYGLFTILFWLTRVVFIGNKKIYLYIYPFALFLVSYLIVFLINGFNGLEFKLIFTYIFVNYFLLGFWILNIFLYISYKICIH
ncbi:hypothetical protein D0T92_09075 [Neisseria zalophi]|uniref:Uncharacterized protein n=1 Tax=Neisseria zalophi TaxID=640030 RepID=A0A5J6PWM2_9NEIS|nr:hypothetical protein D0T92_09075 [Neisseria zalophi]